MMGDPTSFPVMPMMSAFSSEKAGHPRSDGKLCGDDALLSSFGPEKVDKYEAEMARLGGVISKKKTFVHPSKGIFCEVPHLYGTPQTMTLISNWSAPPGGSKGSINWMNQSLTIHQQYTSQGRSPKSGLWAYSPHWQSQRAAFLMGIPLGAPVEFGGMKHPRFPCASVSNHLRWLTYLSGLSSAQIALGTGLPILRSPYQRFRAFAMQELVRMWQDDPYLGEPIPLVGRLPVSSKGEALLTLTEYSDALAAPLIGWEFFGRAPIVPLRTPSIRKAARRFNQKVSRSPAIAGKYENVRLEVERKAALYVRRGAYKPRPDLNRYGLEPARNPTPRRLSHWVDGRVLWS